VAICFFLIYDACFSVKHGILHYIWTRHWHASEYLKFFIIFCLYKNGGVFLSEARRRNSASKLAVSKKHAYDMNTGHNIWEFLFVFNNLLITPELDKNGQKCTRTTYDRIHGCPIIHHMKNSRPRTEPIILLRLDQTPSLDCFQLLTKQIRDKYEYTILIIF
jgi:hypothetical protein